MTLDEIKAAVDAGQTVHWANTGYVVHEDRLGQYHVTYVPNGSCIGLTDRGGQRLNEHLSCRHEPHPISAAECDESEINMPGI